MINIVFDGSTSGALRLTTDPETGKYISSDDIFEFDLMMDIGYLDQGIESRYRLELPGRFRCSVYCNDVEYEDFSESGKEFLEKLPLLKKRLEAKESVRVWYSDYPSSLCGFFHLCTLLRDYDSEVYSMYAPKCAVEKGRYYLAKGWGSFNLFSFENYFDLQKLICKEEIRAYAEHWDMLTEQNSPLRTVIAGFPVSVEKDFYDCFIIPEIPDEPIENSELVYRVIQRNESLPPTWIFSRINLTGLYRK